MCESIQTPSTPTNRRSIQSGKVGGRINYLERFTSLSGYLGVSTSPLSATLKVNPEVDENHGWAATHCHLYEEVKKKVYSQTFASCFAALKTFPQCFSPIPEVSADFSQAPLQNKFKQRKKQPLSVRKRSELVLIGSCVIPQNLAVFACLPLSHSNSLSYYPKCAHSVCVCALVPAVLAHSAQPERHRRGRFRMWPGLNPPELTPHTFIKPHDTVL